MDHGRKNYSARQLLGFLEREVILRGRLPLFSELAYRGDGPPMDAYMDLLGDGDWTALQAGVSAWLGATGYVVDREGNLVTKLPPTVKATPSPASQPAKAGDSPAPPISSKKKPSIAPRRRTMLQVSEVVEQDYSKMRLDALSTECARSIDRRFPPRSSVGQQLVGHKIVNALTGLLTGQTIGYEDGRNLIRTLLCLIFPEAALNQLTVSPLFWREDPLGGLIAKANTHLYGEQGLITVAEGVERLGIAYGEMADRLSHNELTLVFTRSYMLSRDEVSAFQARGHTPRPNS
jgi:hypothetical protein